MIGVVEYGLYSMLDYAGKHPKGTANWAALAGTVGIGVTAGTLYEGEGYDFLGPLAGTIFCAYEYSISRKAVEEDRDARTEQRQVFQAMNWMILGSIAYGFYFYEDSENNEEAVLSISPGRVSLIYNF